MAAVIAAGLSGCAEFKNRGGAVDWLEDRFVFRADTKDLRVLRSGILLAGLTRVASRSPITQAERQEIARIVLNTVNYINTALACTDPKKFGSFGCAFFDDRMASIDYALIRLARAVFMPEENKDLMALIRKGLGEETGATAALSDVLDFSGRIIDTAGQGLKIGGQALDATGAIVRIVQNSFKVGGRLTPIYRDSVELEMQIAITFLRELGPDHNVYPKGVSAEECAQSDWMSFRAERDKSDAYSAAEWQIRLECQFAEGAGEMRNWQHNLHAFFRAPRFRALVKPKPSHWAQVNELQNLACTALVGDPKCEVKSKVE